MKLIKVSFTPPKKKKKILHKTSRFTYRWNSGHSKKEKTMNNESQSFPEPGNKHTNPTTGFINSNSLVVGCSPWIKSRINHAAALAGGARGLRLQFLLWKESYYLHPITCDYYYSSFAVSFIPYTNLGNGHISYRLPPSTASFCHS